MSLALWAAAPTLLGWHPTTVVTGSMSPHINPGDVISARPVPASSLRVGMVLLVDDPDHPKQLRLHRLVEFSPDGRLVLRGDANPQADSSHVDPRAVRGVGSVRVPYVAIPILWIHEKAWVKLVLLVAAILALVAAMGLDRDPSAVSTEEQTGPTPTEPTPTEPTSTEPTSTEPTGTRPRRTERP
jgi:signal peptidase